MIIKVSTVERRNWRRSLKLSYWIEWPSVLKLLQLGSEDWKLNNEEQRKNVKRMRYPILNFYSSSTFEFHPIKQSNQPIVFATSNLDIPTWRFCTFNVTEFKCIFNWEITMYVGKHEQLLVYEDAHCFFFGN